MTRTGAAIAPQAGATRAEAAAMWSRKIHADNAGSEREEKGGSLRLIPVTELEPGMRVARSLYDPYGHRLVASGRVLDAKIIGKIAELGFKTVYVDDGREKVELHEVVCEETRAAAVAVLYRFASSITARPSPPTRVVQATIQLLVEEILSAEVVILALAQMKAMVDQLFNHSVNVAILSLMVGHTLGFTRSQLQQLGIGALLHDIGKIWSPLLC